MNVIVCFSNEYYYTCGVNTNKAIFKINKEQLKNNRINT